MKKSLPSQRDINERIAPHVPRRAWRSTISIVGAKKPRGGHIGTGTLFQVADVRFVVTASHVIGALRKYDMTPGLGDTETPNLIPLTNDWMCSVPQNPGEPIDDLHDVAVNRLPTDVAQRLDGKQFLRTTDVYDGNPGPRAVFSLFGYPGIWAQPIASPEGEIVVKPLEFTTFSYNGNPRTQPGYDERLHLLLSGGPEDITHADGSPMEFLDRQRQPVRFPRALKGISGCSVWLVGDLDVPIERWSDRPPCLVGIVSAIRQAAGIIWVSRWTCATTLIHEAFPDLRPALGLWRA